MSDSPLPALPLTQKSAEIQAALDADHLRLLEIGYYISAVMTGFRLLWFLMIAVFFAVGGVASVYAVAHGQSHDGAPPAIFFAIIAVVLGIVILLTLIFTGLEIYAGICLKQRKHPVLIQAVAAFYCLSIPWGTAIGVFTFMVLNRPV